DLSEGDRAMLRQYAYKLRNHITDTAYNELEFLFPSEDVLSIKAAQTRIALLAGFKPQLYDCCPNSCLAYTGPRDSLNDCPECKTPRYKADGRARKRFTYIPLIPRLRACAASPAVATQMRYRAFEHKSHSDEISDVFDGKHYQELCQRNVVVNDVELPRKFFDDPRDIALGLSTDGFAPFRRRKTTC
ncbi:hypothetical protein BV25DRAFT_1789773, partial [Artomyces pyxidatus]